MTNHNTSPLGTPASYAVSELVAIELDAFGHEILSVVATFDTDEQALAYIHATKITHPTRGRSFKKGSLLEGACHAGFGVLWAASRPASFSVPHNPTF